MLCHFRIDNYLDIFSINTFDSCQAGNDCIMLSQELLCESKIIWCVSEFLYIDQVAYDLVNHLLVLASELFQSHRFRNLTFRRLHNLFKAAEVVLPVGNVPLLKDQAFLSKAVVW